MGATKVIETAYAELLNTENPPGSNRTKYGKEYGFDGVLWCVIFLWWCFKQAGESMAFFGGAKTASCETLMKWYQEQSLIVPYWDICPGDIVILDFSGRGDTQHCGLVTKIIDLDKGYIQTIEGNTSPGLEGSQDNGGCVALKIRTRKNIVGVLRPMYSEEKKTDYEGHWAEPAIKFALEKGFMKGYPDGSFKPDAPLTRAEAAQLYFNIFGGIQNE